MQSNLLFPSHQINPLPTRFDGSFFLRKNFRPLTIQGMTLIDFVNKHIKTKVDFDGRYGAQCVDLFRQYCMDVLGIPEHTGAVVGAKDLFLNYDNLPNEKKHFAKLDYKNSPLAYEGDVAVWGATPTNEFGHVAIVLHDKGDLLIVFEQDGFKQDGAKIKLRQKSGLLGYLQKW